jgi:phospholipase D-like protein
VFHELKWNGRTKRHDPKAPIRRLPFVFAQEESQDREAEKSGNVQNAGRRREARESHPVLQAALTRRVLWPYTPANKEGLVDHTVIGTIILVLDIVAIVSVLIGRGSVGHKVLWIVLILLLPIIGMVLYYLIGRSPADA